MVRRARIRARAWFWWYARPADDWEHRKQLDLPPPNPIAAKEGSVIKLRCVTPGEVALVVQELEREDILVSVPSYLAQVRECRKKGYVELTIAATAYESIPKDLRSSVEYQYYVPPAERPLPLAGKIIGVLAGFTIIPGLLPFFWLFTRYLNNGDDKKARQFLYSFLLGFACWLAIIVLAVTVF